MKKIVAIRDPYLRLKEKVEGGVLEIFEIISPPRTGSTALGKYFYMSETDAQITEPAAKFASGEARVDDTYKDLLEIVEGIEGTTRERPIRLVLKEIAQHIGPREEAELFFSLAKNIIVLLRNPVLAIESHMTASLLEIFHVSPKTEEQLKEWLIEEADTTHIDDNKNESAWIQHLDYMKKNRDYSSLNNRLWFTPTNSLFGTKSLQREVWGYLYDCLKERGEEPNLVAQKLNYRNWDAMLDAHIGTPLQDMLDENFPDVLKESFETRQGGWCATDQLFDSLKDRDNFFGTIDFTSFCLQPEKFGPKMIEDLGLRFDPDKQLGDSELQTGYGELAEEISGYEDTMFGNAKQNKEILAPKKIPISLEKFPSFVTDHIKEHYKTYIKLLKEKAIVTGLDLDKPETLSIDIASRDPIYTYIQFRILGKEELALDIKQKFPKFKNYFDMIDEIKDEIK